MSNRKKRILPSLLTFVMLIVVLVSLQKDRFFDIEAEKGVSVFVKTQVDDGFNLFTDERQKTAWLVDMDGSLAHQWSSSGGKRKDGWHHVELQPKGDLLTVIKNQAIAKLSWDSQPIWSSPGGFHHDLAVAPNGDIYALERVVESITVSGKTFSILGDSIVVLDPKGNRKSKIHLTPLLLSSVEKDDLRQAEEFFNKTPKQKIKTNSPGDIFHCNTIEVITRNIEGVAQEGDLLLSVRNTDEVLILRPSTKEIVLRFGKGILDGQHQPSLLANGNLLVFDNGEDRGYSRILEVNLVTKKVAWSLDKVDGARFYSARRGGVEEVGKGNLLVTSGDTGVVFEVSRGGELLWLYRNPNFETKKSVEEGKVRVRRYGILYRVARIADIKLLPATFQQE